VITLSGCHCTEIQVYCGGCFLELIVNTGMNVYKKRSEDGFTLRQTNNSNSFRKLYRFFKLH
jgi:hypothetical protein